jgi:hypothetical protein
LGRQCGAGTGTLHGAIDTAAQGGGIGGHNERYPFPAAAQGPLAFDGMGIKIGIGYYHAGRPQAAVLPDNVLFESGANWREHPLELFRKGAALPQS